MTRAHNSLCWRLFTAHLHSCVDLTAVAKEPDTFMNAYIYLRRAVFTWTFASILQSLHKNLIMSIWPQKAALCRAVRPDVASTWLRGQGIKGFGVYEFGVCGTECWGGKSARKNPGLPAASSSPPDKISIGKGSSPGGRLRSPRETACEPAPQTRA